jgi:hypothetical protein
VGVPHGGQLLCGGRIVGAGIKLRLGKDEEALALSLAAQPLVDTAGASHDVLRGYAMLALGRLRAGNRALARAAAEKALVVIRATRPVAYWTYDGICAAAEVLLTLWEEAGPRAPRDLVQRAREACKGARAFAKVFPIGEPFALLCDGVEARLSGDASRADRALARCIARAEALGMPYERGRAHLERGRHLPASDPARARDLRRAADIFAELGTGHDLARATSLL